MNSSTNETKNAKSGTNSNVVQFNSDERVLDAASEWLVKLDEGLDDNETQALKKMACNAIASRHLPRNGSLVGQDVGA